jgi:S1/P1 Nuclease
VRVTQAGQPMNLHRFWDGVITSSSNLTRLRNEATALRNRQEFQRSQLTELASTDFESWGKESFEIATKIAYRNGGLNGSPRAGNKDCTMVVAAPVLLVGYVVSARRIADRRMISLGQFSNPRCRRIGSKYRAGCIVGPTAFLFPTSGFYRK